ncbi:MAG: Hsp20/alpha crystallin family protein, partial [Deltaproteobacteria bacterium]
MEDPFTAFQREMNALIQDFFGRDPFASFGMLDRPWPWSGNFTPSVNVKETDKGFEVTAEIPGVDEKDIDLSLSRNALTIKGEKKMEHEEKEEGYYRMERSFGAFTRTIPFPVEVDPDGVEATYRKGVLTVQVPKS